MSESTQRKILISPELREHQIGFYFQELGFTLCFEFDQALQYEFIVDQYLPEIDSVPRLFTQNLAQALSHKGAFSYFDPKYLKYDPVKFALQAGLSEKADYDLLGRFCKDAKNVLSVRIQDYLNIGFFVDQIIVEAYKNDFPIEGLRDFLNLSLQYSFGQLKNSRGNSGVEISYSHSKNGLALELSFTMPGLRIDRQSELYFKLNTSCNCLIVNHYKKRDRFVFSALWFKSPELHSFHANFFAEIIGKKATYSELPEVTNQIDETSTAVVFEPNAYDPVEGNKIFLARKFARIIRENRSSESDPKPTTELNIDDVSNYLAQYPHQDIVEKLDLETKEMILQFLLNENLDASISEYIQRISGANLESIANDITRVLGSKSRNDFLNAFVVSGTTSKIDEGFVRVKGWIGGMDDEAWQASRNNIIETIKQEVLKAKQEGRSISKENIYACVAEQIQLPIEDAEIIVNQILEDIVGNRLLSKVQTEEGCSLSLKVPSLEEEQFQDIENFNQLAIAFEKLRVENKELRESLFENNKKGLNSEKDSEKEELKRELVNLIQTSRIKEEQLLRGKELAEKSSARKDETIGLLENKIIELNNKIARVRHEYNGERVEQLAAENKILTSKLELAQGKLNVISENLDKQKNSDSGKRETLIKHFAQEKSLLEERLKAAHLEVKKSELRLRNAMIQLDDLQKGKTPQTQAEKTTEHYTKQIEGFNARITEAGKELTEKKKEIHKLRSENNNLLTKVAELEKKLYSKDKKAA